MLLIPIKEVQIYHPAQEHSPTDPVFHSPFEIYIEEQTKKKVKLLLFLFIICSLNYHYLVIM